MSDAQAAQVTENGVLPAAQGAVIEEAPGFKVFVGNLAYSTLEEGLKTFFAPVQSDIISVQVIKRGSRPAGYGFVAMSSAEAAQRAIETLNGQELDGREVIIEIAKPVDQKDRERQERARRPPGRRGGKPVPGEVTDAEANGDVKTDNTADAAPGDGEGAKPKKKKKFIRRPRRKDAPADTAKEAAPETPATEAATAEAAAAAPKMQPRRRFRPRPPRPVGEDPVGEPSKSMLFVANLGFNIDDEGLSALFTEVGIHVLSARVVRKQWGRHKRSKGFGFVDVGNEEEQQKAMSLLQGKEVEGRAIAVKIAVNTIKGDEAEATPSS